MPPRRTLPASPSSRCPPDRDAPALQGAVWSPCAQKPAGRITLGPIEIEASEGCAVQGQRLPLIVVSHGYGGSFLSQHDTAQALADAGFVVAAVNHSQDNHRIRGSAKDSLEALVSRSADIRRLVDHMLRKWPQRERLSQDFVGFYGFSRGGFTGLVLAGAQPDFTRLPNWPSSPCHTAPQGAECERIQQFQRDLNKSPLTRDPRIKAAVIADPLASVFSAQSLQPVRIPIQLWASEYGGDGVTPDSVLSLGRDLPHPQAPRVPNNSDHFGFLPPCAPALAAVAPEICTDRPGFDRQAFHVQFNRDIVAFFRQQL